MSDKSKCQATIDMEARSKVARSIRAYMNEEIAAFQFDDDLGETASETTDKTVKDVVELLWFTYDDVTDHTIVASKELWDLFNRLLLVLESGGTIESIDHGREWNLTQGFAAFFLAAFLVLAVVMGWDERLFFVSIPFGVASMVLARLNSRREKHLEPTAWESAMTPFTSFGTLLTARRLVPNFIKLRYPKKLSKRVIRGPIMSCIMWLPSIVAWLMLSPFVLLFQTLPTRRGETHISFPDDSSRAVSPTVK